MSKLTPSQKLLKWCQHVTKDYSNVDIQNFSKSWKDGLAFSAIIHHFRPDVIDFGSLKAGESENNVKVAFDAANKLGITQYLEVEDLMLPAPEPKTLQMQVYEYYQFFSNPDNINNMPVEQPTSPIEQQPSSTLDRDLTTASESSKVEETPNDLEEVEKLRDFLRYKDAEEEKKEKQAAEIQKTEEKVQKQETQKQENQKSTKVVKEEQKVTNAPAATSQWLNDLVQWRQPIVSGTVLALFYAVLILVKFYEFSFITLAGRVIQFSILVGILGQILAKFGIEILSMKLLNAKFETRSDLIRPFTDIIIMVCEYLLPIVLIKSPLRSIRFVFVLQIISVIGKWFSGLTLAAIVFHIAMFGPMIYKLYGKHIDEALQKAHVQYEQVQSQIAKNIPPAVSNAYGTVKNKIE